jgi:phosphatidylserine/phosphatidylglycerophosphate/cardiolipin synthase-like enzyme
MSRVGRIYARMILRARRHVTVAMAYFIPVGVLLRAFLRARKRRVGVRVIVPGVSGSIPGDMKHGSGGACGGERIGVLERPAAREYDNVMGQTRGTRFVSPADPAGVPDF